MNILGGFKLEIFPYLKNFFSLCPPPLKQKTEKGSLYLSPPIMLHKVILYCGSLSKDCVIVICMY